MFNNRVLKKILGSKRDEVKGEWRILYNEELYDLYSPRNIVRVTKSRRMRWAEQVARMVERRGVCMVLMEKPEEKSHLENSGVNGRIILN
jgi:hypothetical protein